MAVCVSVPCNPPPYAHVDIDGVGNAEINVDVDDVGDVDGGLQGTDTHTAICWPSFSERSLINPTAT